MCVCACMCVSEAQHETYQCLDEVRVGLSCILLHHLSMCSLSPPDGTIRVFMSYKGVYELPLCETLQL